MSKNELITDITTVLHSFDSDTLLAIDRTVHNLSNERKPGLITKLVSFLGTLV